MYKNSGREKGTLRFFREKLNRRNVTLDVKHFEDCEQLFVSIGKCFAIEALLEFFQMKDTKCKPMANVHYGSSEASKKSYITSTLDQFLDQYVFVDQDDALHSETTDRITCYAINVLKSFLLLADFKDAVARGNGQHLSILRKQLLMHFFSTTGLNEYAIEMLVSILQSEVLLSQAEAFQCKWAATVNWKGGAGHNIEIDLFQENMNRDMKQLIRSMGANKSEKAISRASKASGGVRKIVESFNEQVNIHRKSSAHSHKSSLEDERVILEDLRALRPFQQVEGRSFDSFNDISHDPIHTLDKSKFQKWIARHKKNMLVHHTVLEDDEDSDEEGSDED